MHSSTYDAEREKGNCMHIDKERNMKPTKTLALTALFIAIGIILPSVFHAFGAGSVFLPMHIPVLLCGLICGPFWGLAAGIITPILSSMMTGMPPAGILPSMLCELVAYGFFSGLFIHMIRTSRNIVNLYASLILTMLLGRIIAGILNAIVFKAGAYSLAVWISAMFVQGLPGILIQLTIIPAAVLALQKAKLIQMQQKTAKA